jgi:hypothetical protein
VGPPSCKIWQLTCCMGLEWREICPCASKATTLSKSFHYENPYIYSLNIVQYCINTEYFSLLQVKNEAYEGVMNVRLFLSLLIWLGQ